MDKVLIAPATLAGVQAGFSMCSEGRLRAGFPEQKGQMLEHELLEQLTGVKAAAPPGQAVHEKVLQASAVA